MEATQRFSNGQPAWPGSCVQWSFSILSFTANKVANWSFLGDPGSLPSFVAKGMSCSFYIFVPWALKVDRPRSSKNSSINVSRFWNSTAKTRKSGTVGVTGKWCQMLSEVFAEQMWPQWYLDSVHSQRRLWGTIFVIIILVSSWDSLLNCSAAERKQLNRTSSRRCFL